MNWKTKSICLSATGIFLVASTLPGIAQKVGSYTGQSADGNTVSLTVTGSPGSYEIGNMSVGFTAPCKSGTATEGWGFTLNTPLASNGSTPFVSRNDEYYISGGLHFTSNTKIEGNIESRTAVFVPGPTPPTAAHFCHSPKQSFTLKFQSTSMPVSIGPGNQVVHRIDPETPPY